MRFKPSMTRITSKDWPQTFFQAKLGRVMRNAQWEEPCIPTCLKTSWMAKTWAKDGNWVLTEPSLKLSISNKRKLLIKLHLILPGKLAKRWFRVTNKWYQEANSWKCPLIPPRKTWNKIYIIMITAMLIIQERVNICSLQRLFHRWNPTTLWLVLFLRMILACSGLINSL